MKRIVCVVLSGMLLLAGCQKPAVTPTTAPTTVVTTATTAETIATTVETTVPTTTITEPATTTTTLSEEERQEQYYNQLIDEFLLAWQAGDAEELRTYPAAMATLLAEGVKVESYRLEHSADDKPHRLTLSVSKSSVPAVPVGESEWWIRVTEYDGFYVELCPIDEDYNARWSRLGVSDGLPVWFCSRMATELDLFDTVKDFSRLSPEELGTKGGTLVRLHNAWLSVTEEDPDLPAFVSTDAIRRFTEQVLGVTVTDFSASRTYVPATETEEAQLELEGYGGKWHYAGLVSHTQKSDVHTVTIRYFADTTRLVEAVTMRYTAQQLGNGTFRLLSCQRLSGGTYPPARGNT